MFYKSIFIAISQEYNITSYYLENRPGRSGFPRGFNAFSNKLHTKISIQLKSQGLECIAFAMTSMRCIFMVHNFGGRVIFAPKFVAM